MNVQSYEDYNRMAEALEHRLTEAAPKLKWSVDKVGVGELITETQKRWLNFYINAEIELNKERFVAVCPIDTYYVRHTQQDLNTIVKQVIFQVAHTIAHHLMELGNVAI